ncbi:MAG: hypothetical protein ACK5UN_00830, partial [Planctomycetota bacterium]
SKTAPRTATQSHQLSKPLRSILSPLAHPTEAHPPEAHRPEAHRPEYGKLCTCEALCISQAF